MACTPIQPRGAAKAPDTVSRLLTPSTSRIYNYVAPSTSRRPSVIAGATTVGTTSTAAATMMTGVTPRGVGGGMLAMSVTKKNIPAGLFSPMSCAFGPRMSITASTPSATGTAAAASAGVHGLIQAIPMCSLDAMSNNAVSDLTSSASSSASSSNTPFATTRIGTALLSGAAVSGRHMSGAGSVARPVARRLAVVAPPPPADRQALSEKWNHDRSAAPSPFRRQQSEQQQQQQQQQHHSDHVGTAAVAADPPSVDSNAQMSEELHDILQLLLEPLLIHRPSAAALSLICRALSTTQE